MSAVMIRVALAEDHHMVRAGLRLLLSRIDGVTVVGEAGNGEELLKIVRDLEPDVALTDLNMPGMDGYDAIAAIRASHPSVRVVALTMNTALDDIRKAVRLGACGYLTKNCRAWELEQGVRAVMAVGSYFSAGITQRLLAEVPMPPADEGLSPQQKSILSLLARGVSPREIGERLSLSRKTVEEHRANIKRLLCLPDTAGLTRYAMRKGLI